MMHVAADVVGKRMDLLYSAGMLRRRIRQPHSCLVIGFKLGSIFGPGFKVFIQDWKAKDTIWYKFASG